MLFWSLKSTGCYRRGCNSSCRQCSSLSQQSVSYYEKKVKHKTLFKMQTARIKSIRLFHTFCFYTYIQVCTCMYIHKGTAHPVEWFLLPVWKKCWEKCLCEPPALLFFSSQGVCTSVPTGSYFIWMTNIMPCKVTQVQMHCIFCLRGLMGLRLTYLR